MMKMRTHDTIFTRTSTKKPLTKLEINPNMKAEIARIRMLRKADLVRYRSRRIFGRITIKGRI